MHFEIEKEEDWASEGQEGEKGKKERKREYGQSRKKN